MASEQGFLDYPGRFLTLWKAFAADRRSSHVRNMAAWQNDTEWRLAFIDWYQQRLESDTRERFDSKAFVELAPAQREVLLWLGHNHPRGTTWSRMEDAMTRRGHADGAQSVDLLIDHLELVEHYGPFEVKGEGRLRQANNNTPFQVSVFPELFSGGSRKKRRLPAAW